MSDQFQWRPRSYLAAAAVALVAALALLFVLPRFWFSCSRLNNKEIEMDLNSGRVRHTKHFLFAQSSRRVSETAVSSVLPAKDRLPGEEWVTICDFAGGSGVSPHFVYHSALAQVNMLQRCWNASDVTHAARAKTAGQLLYVLREGGQDSPANRYLDLLWKECSKLELRGCAINADDIPNDLPELALGRRQPATAPTTKPLTQP